jgi:hypothetical protein
MVKINRHNYTITKHTEVTMSNNKQQTAVDAYCPECETYICDERVTFEECCDTCGTHIEYHTKHTEVTNESKRIKNW